MSQEVSDEELIKNCIVGIPPFQRMLYKRFASKMLTICMRYSSSREEAEDILQEGFIVVFDKLKQFKMEGSFEGWVRKIMVNKAIEAYHHSSRLQPLIDINDVGDNFVSEEDILSNIAAKDLLRMIQELPPVYKMVFNLHVFEKMTHKEIAAQLGIAEGTSKSNLSDAKTLLKKKINKSMTVLQKRAF